MNLNHPLCKSPDWLTDKRIKRKSDESYIYQEVESTTNYIATNKTLGPDGLNGELFHWK